MSSYSEYETAYGIGLLDDLHNYFPALLYGEPSSFRSVSEVLQYIQNQTRQRFDLFSRGHRQYMNRNETVYPSTAPAAAAVPAPVPAPVPVPAVAVAVPSATAPSSQSPEPASLHLNLNLPRSGSFSRRRTYAQAAGSTASNFPNSLPGPVFPIPVVQPRTPIVRYYTTNTHPVTEDDDDDEDEALLERTATQLIQNLLQMPVVTTGLTRYTVPLTNMVGLNQNAMDAFLEPVIVRPTPEQITQFTTVGNLSSDEEPLCAICQETLRPDEEGRKLNACGHWFHRGCIDTWFARNIHCPNCRHDIREPLEQRQ